MDLNGLAVLPTGTFAERYAYGGVGLCKRKRRLLTLADWPAPAGVDTLVRALFEVGSGDIFNDSGSGAASGQFLDGDRELESGQNISRIRNSSGNLRINDQPSGENLGAYFAAGGAGEGGTWYLTTLDGTSSILASTNSANPNNVVFGWSGAISTALTGLSSGDRFILGYTVHDYS